MADDIAKSVSLHIDGKTIELHGPGTKTDALNKALVDSANFKKFAAHPAAFAKDFGLSIDHTISTQLSQKLIGMSSIEELTMRGDIGGEATAWAVAAGSYSVASTKIAVAF